VLSRFHLGSFERSFQIPEGVATDRIDASFKEEVLSLTLPKKPEAQKAANKIDVKAAWPYRRPSLRVPDCFARCDPEGKFCYCRAAFGTLQAVSRRSNRKFSSD
jgi:hypothetical protein